MIAYRRTEAALLTAVASLALVVPLLAAPARPAFAQAEGMGGIGDSQKVTVRAQVRAIDLAKREVTLVGPQGNVVTAHVSDIVQNLDRVKVGDNVVATYYASIVLVLSPPGAKIPDDQITAAAARAEKGQLPAGAAGVRTVVTGTVVGVDLGAHTILLVNPSGGLVRTFNVTDPRALAALPQVKVGDSLTVIATDTLAVAIDPV